MTEEWRPRLSVNITPEQYSKLQKLVPWGVKGQLFQTIIEDLIDLLETKCEKVLGAILAKKLKLENYSIGKEVENVKD